MITDTDGEKDNQIKLNQTSNIHLKINIFIYKSIRFYIVILYILKYECAST